MSYLDQLNASPKFEIFSPEKPKHSYFLKLTSSFLPIFVLALGLGAALILMRDRQKVTTKASLETTNLVMVSNGYDVNIFAAFSSGKLVAIELPITYPSDLLEYQGFATSSGFPNLLPASFVIVAAPPTTPMTSAGLVGTLKFRSKGVGGVAHIAFGAVRIAGLNSQNEPLSENLAGSLTGVDIIIVGPTPTTPVATATLGASPSPSPTVQPTATVGANTPTPTPTERPYNNCGGTCGSNMNCKGELYCYFPDIKNRPYDGICRNPLCDQSTDCSCKPTATPSPRPTSLPLSPTSTKSPSPTIKPTATLIPTPFVIRISSPTSPTATIGASPTSIPSTDSRVPSTPEKEPGWWDKFVEWLRSLFGE